MVIKNVKFALQIVLQKYFCFVIKLILSLFYEYANRIWLAVKVSGIIPAKALRFFLLQQTCEDWSRRRPLLELEYLLSSLQCDSCASPHCHLRGVVCHSAQFLA